MPFGTRPTHAQNCRVRADISGVLVWISGAVGRGFPRWAQLVRAIDFLRDIRNLAVFAADERERRRGEPPADFGQIHALQSVAFGAQR